MVSHQQPNPSGFRHRIVPCAGSSHVADTAATFIEQASQSSQPVMVALPAPRWKYLEPRLSLTGDVRFVDMTELGRNPARIIPAVMEFVQEVEGAPCLFLGEPMWPGRSRAETDEVSRHELLVEPALGAHAISIVSLYDTEVATPPAAEGSASDVLSEHRWPLEAPPGHAYRAGLRFGGDLSSVRSYVHQGAERARMETQRVEDLVLAANEVASNSVRFGGGGGEVTVWVDGGAVSCEVIDTGMITDPLVGRYPPGPALEAKGLWLVNQLCDLVQIRSGHDGTRIRLTLDC